MDNRVSIDAPAVEFTTEGTFESHISKEYADSLREIDTFYQDFFGSPSEEIPLSIFSQDLSPLQALVKYLKDSRNLSFSEIARKTSRDPRTIWSTYDAVRNDSLAEIPSDIFVSLDVFANRDLSTLESLVQHLIGLGLSVGKIASLMGKNYQTIWTVKRRISEKGGGADE